jgi:PAS domain-containing protein
MAEKRHSIIGMGVKREDPCNLTSTQHNKVEPSQLGMRKMMLDEALTQFQCPFFIKDIDRTYRYVNPKAAELADLPSHDFIGRKDEEIFGEMIGKIYREKDLAVLRGEKIDPLDTFTDAKGVRRTYFIIRQVLFDSKKQPIGILGLRVDISEYIPAIAKLINCT